MTNILQIAFLNYFSSTIFYIHFNCSRVSSWGINWWSGCETCRYRFNTLRQRQYDHLFTENIFKSIFLNETIWILNKSFTEICSLGSYKQNGSIGSDNGSVTTRRQAIIWSNVDMLYWCIYLSIGLSELRNSFVLNRQWVITKLGQVLWRHITTIT